jgi:hypothetical protein
MLSQYRASFLLMCNLALKGSFKNRVFLIAKK